MQELEYTDGEQKVVDNVNSAVSNIQPGMQQLGGMFINGVQNTVDFATGAVKTGIDAKSALDKAVFNHTVVPAVNTLEGAAAGFNQYRADVEAQRQAAEDKRNLREAQELADELGYTLVKNEKEATGDVTKIESEKAVAGDAAKNDGRLAETYGADKDEMAPKDKGAEMGA